MSSSQPKHIGNVLSELMARRGYARVQSGSAFADAWREAAGPQLAASSRATQVRRGVLEVLASNSTIAQEIGFQKPALLQRLTELLPDANIRGLKLRIGSIS